MSQRRALYVKRNLGVPSFGPLILGLVQQLKQSSVRLSRSKSLQRGISKNHGTSWIASLCLVCSVQTVKCCLQSFGFEASEVHVDTYNNQFTFILRCQSNIETSAILQLWCARRCFDGELLKKSGLVVSRMHPLLFVARRRILCSNCRSRFCNTSIMRAMIFSNLANFSLSWVTPKTGIIQTRMQAVQMLQISSRKLPIPMGYFQIRRRDGSMMQLDLRYYILQLLNCN